jgi:chromatin segregation and condensation protein Rec8/ScpA/Scc1 (kleisin family)
MFDLGSISRWDLLGTFSRLMRETLADRPHHISGEARPLRFYVERLAKAVRATPRIGFRELLLEINPEPSRETLVGSFCAILELIKLGIISASQDGNRGEIRVEFMADVDADLDHLLDAAHFEDEDSEETEGDRGP